MANLWLCLVVYCAVRAPPTVAGVLLEALGSEGAALARPLIAQLGTLLDGQEAAAEEEEAAAAASGQQVAGSNGGGRGSAMEAAVTALGVALR
jgi:hypothetical protein